MGTRLLSEHLIKKHCPTVKYVRIHTDGKNRASIYAWNEDLRLSEAEITELKRFVDGYLLQHVCFEIKEYTQIQEDAVPPVFDLPEPIFQSAMNSQLNQFGILSAINSLFSSGDMTFYRYDIHSATIHFRVHTSAILTTIEQELIHRYLYEMVPLGAKYEVTYTVAS